MAVRCDVDVIIELHIGSMSVHTLHRDVTGVCAAGGVRDVCPARCVLMPAMFYTSSLQLPLDTPGQAVVCADGKAWATLAACDSIVA